MMMKQQPRFDLDIDKHYNATVVIACTTCGHETRQHLKSLPPDRPVRCACGADISMSNTELMQAERLASELKQSYRIH